MLNCILVVVVVYLRTVNAYFPNPSYLNPIKSSTTESFTAPNVVFSQYIRQYFLTTIENNSTVLPVYSSIDLAQWAHVGYISDNMQDWTHISSVNLFLRGNTWFVFFTGYNSYQKKHCIGYGYSHTPKPIEFSLSDKTIYCNNTFVVSDVIVFESSVHSHNKVVPYLMLFSLSNGSISEIYTGELSIMSSDYIILIAHTIQVALSVNNLIRWESNKLYPNALIYYNDYLYLFYTAGDVSLTGLGIGVAMASLNKLPYSRNILNNNPILRSTNSSIIYKNTGSISWDNPNHCSVIIIRDHGEKFAIVYSARDSFKATNVYSLSVIMLDSLIYENNWFTISSKSCKNYDTPSTCKHYLFEA